MKISAKHISVLTFLLLGSFTNVLAQKKFNVLPWHGHNTLFHYLIEHVDQQYQQRLSELRKATLSRQAMLEYKNSRHERYLKLLGKLPKRTPLHVQITGTIQRDGYRIEKIIYQSFPHHHVTADLYIPDGKGPFPGVLFFCGHEKTSKATESYQKTAILFATHGFVILVIDPISQGERLQLTNKEGKTLTPGRSSTTGHTLLDAGANLVGTSVVAYELYDNERGLDYLRSLPEVDTTRIGCIGNSGGGTQSTYFMAYEPRIKVASVCSFVTRRERVFYTIGPQDGCWWLPFEGRERLDIGDYLIMHAPKPLLILAAKYDFFDFSGTRDTYHMMRKVYHAFGAKQKVHMFSWSDGHGISKPKREAAVTFFRKWFYGDTTHVKEGNLSILPEKELNCTKTGQVNTSFNDEIDVQDHNMMVADTLKRWRAVYLAHISGAKLIRRIRKSLALPKTENHNVTPEWRGAVNMGTYSLHKVILRRKGQTPMPCLVMYPKNQVHPVKTVIWFPEKGKASIAENSSLMNSYYSEGDAVILADMRGMGETEDPYPSEFNSKKYYNHEYRVAQMSLHIGKPLPGQRTEDVMTVMDFIRQNPNLRGTKIDIYATGTAAPPVLYAALFDHDISKMYLSNTIESYQYIVDHPLMKDAFSYVIPNVLKYYDLPDVVRLVGENKVIYKSPVK